MFCLLQWKASLRLFFIKLSEFTGKSSANNPKQYRKLIRKIVKEVIINTFHLKLQLLPATSQDSGEFIFEQDCCSAHPQNTLFYDINISQGSAATRLRWGGIFNDSFIATFQENVIVKEFWKSASIWRSYVQTTLAYFFWDHPVYRPTKLNAVTLGYLFLWWDWFHAFTTRRHDKQKYFLALVQPFSVINLQFVRMTHAYM